MNATSIPARAAIAVPTEIEIACHELSRQLRQTFALLSSAREALNGGNNYIADVLLGMAEDVASGREHLNCIGRFLGVDLCHHYGFDQPSQAATSEEAA